jgi:hypothetical protein
MRVLVSAVLLALPQVLDVLLLEMLVIFFFGLVGVQLYGGRFHYRCVNVNASFETTQVCSANPSYGIQCGKVLGSNFTCTNHNAANIPFPNYPSAHAGFDNIWYAMLTVFQIITLEGWTEVWYSARDALSSAHFLYFWIVVLIGNYFVVNLLLAVFVFRFKEVKRSEERKLGILGRQQQRRHSSIIHQLEGKVTAGIDLQELQANLVTDRDVNLIVLHGRVHLRSELSYFQRNVCVPALTAKRSPWFSAFFLFVVIFHFCLLALFYFGVPNAVQMYSSTVCTGLLCVELVVLLLADGGMFFRDALRVIDMLVVLANIGVLCTGAWDNWRWVLGIRSVRGYHVFSIFAYFFL